MYRAIIVLMLFSGYFSAQQVYEIPFASSGNIINLRIDNKQEPKIGDLTVLIKEFPEWIEFDEKIVYSSEEELNSVFSFDVKKKCEIGKIETVKFEIRDSKNRIWGKSINVKVGLPEEFQLKQNYPNPFNPVTKIEYILAEESKVLLKIYDILGREVKTVVNSEQKAGFHTVKWDASSCASGVYFYILKAKPRLKTSFAQIKKMMLIK